MEEKNSNILEHIHASYFQLTAAERKIADYVLAQYPQIQFMSITQLAEECGTAEATVSRFCRSLGLPGFNAFKIELARHCAGSAPRPVPSHAPDTPGSRAEEIGRLSTDAIRQTLELLDHAQVERAVTLLEKASMVLCLGSGGSMIMAQEFAHLFSNVSGKFHTITDSHMQLSAAATMEPSGVIVLFSYSGATIGGIQILEHAKERGVPTILITRFPKSPAAKLARVVLQCGSNESPFQFGSVPARVAQLIVTDVVFQEYCARNAESCEEHIQRIAAALSEKHV